MCSPNIPEPKDPPLPVIQDKPRITKIRGRKGLQNRKSASDLRQNFNPLAIMTPQNFSQQVQSIGNSLSIAGPGVPNLY